MSDLILVTGATGSAGRAVVNSLLAKGYAVRAAARNINKIPSSVGVETVLFDFEDQSTYGPALEGVAGLFLVAPPMDPVADKKLSPFIDRAREAGVKHLVFLSAFTVDRRGEGALRNIENEVMESGVAWTILRPNFFMENFSAGILAAMVKDQGGIFLAAGDGKTSFVSTEDIAEVTTAAFEVGGVGKAYNLTGPEALDHKEVAELIGKAAGKIVTYHDLPEEEMSKGALESGMPESGVEYLRELYRAVREGYYAEVHDDVKRVTGREAITFRAFVEANKEAWASDC